VFCGASNYVPAADLIADSLCRALKSGDREKMTGSTLATRADRSVPENAGLLFRGARQVVELSGLGTISRFTVAEIPPE